MGGWGVVSVILIRLSRHDMPVGARLHNRLLSRVHIAPILYFACVHLFMCTEDGTELEQEEKAHYRRRR